MRRCAGMLLALALCAGGGPAAAGVAGVAGAKDGDTLVVGGVDVRLYGIDAFESAQSCARADGAPWPCGAAATARLAALIAGAWVRCRPRDVDRWGRVIATCAAGGEDLGGVLVREGLALAYREYSGRYVDDEAAARAARAGAWAGTFEAPWDWRAARRQGGGG